MEKRGGQEPWSDGCGEWDVGEGRGKGGRGGWERREQKEGERGERKEGERGKGWERKAVAPPDRRLPLRSHASERVGDEERRVARLDGDEARGGDRLASLDSRNAGRSRRRHRGVLDLAHSGLVVIRRDDHILSTMSARLSRSVTARSAAESRGHARATPRRALHGRPHGARYGAMPAAHLVVVILDQRVGQAVADASAFQVDLDCSRRQRLVVLPDGVRHGRHIVAGVALTHHKEVERGKLPESA